MYIENANKKLEFNRAFVLASCFLNMHTINSKYDEKLLKEIDEYCPEIFKKALRVPQFYMDAVKSKVK